MRGPAGERERGPTEWAALAAVVSAAALSGLQFGYDTGVISGAILKIADELRLSDTDQELVVAATTLGALISSLLGASIANALGRRPALAIASAIFVVGCAVLGLAPSLWVLLLGRFVVGLAIGASSAVTPVYLAESARSRDRGWLIAVNTMCITGGQVVAALVDALVQDLPGSWRWMLGLGAVPGAFQLFALFFVPESPRFLAMCGRLTEAGSALSYLRGEQSLRAEPAPISAGSGSADDKDPPGADCIEGAPEEAPSETAAILPAREASTAADELLPDARLDSDIESDADADAGRAGASAPAARRRARGRLSSAARSPAVVAELAAIRASVRGGAGALSVRQLLCTSDPALRWAMVLSASAQLAQQLGGVNIAMYYSASLLRQAGFSTSAAIWLAAAVAGVNFLGSAAAALLVERAGRRPLMVWSSVGAAVTLAAAAGAFIVRDAGSPAVAAAAAPCGQGIPLCAYCTAQTDCGFASVLQGPLGWAASGACVPGDEVGPRPGVNVTALLGKPGWTWMASGCPPSTEARALRGPSDAELGWWVFSASVAFLVAFAPGLGSVPWVLQGDLFPTRARAAGNAIATATNWTANMVVSASFLSLVSALHAYGAFLIFACCALASAVWFGLLLPETQGLPLEEVRAILMGKAGGASSRSRRSCC